MPSWSGDLRLIYSFEVTGEIAAAGIHLGRLKPVHVIVDLAHPGGDFLPGQLKAGQPLRYSPALAASKQLNDSWYSCPIGRSTGLVWGTRNIKSRFN